MKNLNEFVTYLRLCQNAANAETKCICTSRVRLSAGMYR